MTWTLTYKAHRNSTRRYRLVAFDLASAHFAAAALRDTGWIVLEVTCDRDTEAGAVPEV